MEALVSEEMCFGWPDASHSPQILAALIPEMMPQALILRPEASKWDKPFHSWTCWRAPNAQRHAQRNAQRKEGSGAVEKRQVLTPSA